MQITLPTPLKRLQECFLIKRSLLFDEAFYRNTYPEIRNQHPIWHYIHEGWQQGKNPSPYFNTSYYLQEYPDVRQAGINPLVHFIRWGRAENRMPRQSQERLYPRYPLWVKAYDCLSIKDKAQIRRKI